jgi:hypothetical protein
MKTFQNEARMCGIITYFISWCSCQDINLRKTHQRQKDQKENITLSIFALDVIIYIENPKESTNT